jgi:DNA-binding MarR family transcriptional regulator
MQDDFTPLEQAAWGGLLGMYGRLFRLIDADLQAHSQITHIEFEVLLRLTWEKGHRLRIQDLATRSVLTRSGVSRVVERLEKIGLVKRERADEDRRGAYAVLTEAGAARLETALPAHVAFVRRHFLTYFTEQELEQMGALWKRVDTAAAAVDES